MPSFAVTNFTGTRNFGPIDIPSGIENAVFSLDATTMTDPAIRGSLQMDLSLDGGVTWAFTTRSKDTDPFPVIMEFEGGAKNRQGQAIPAFTLNCTFPHPEITNRRLRAQLINLNNAVPFSTTATLNAV